MAFCPTRNPSAHLIEVIASGYGQLGYGDILETWGGTWVRFLPSQGNSICVASTRTARLGISAAGSCLAVVCPA